MGERDKKFTIEANCTDAHTIYVMGESLEAVQRGEWDEMDRKTWDGVESEVVEVKDGWD